jgi:hypothetical protein
MKFIKQIDIRKFRSINGLTKIKTNDLNIFVGQNDQGKSNVLRALNLFFNNETDSNTKFRYEDDYCFIANTGRGTRKEIRIDLLISPPKGRFKNSTDIRWIKKWKPDGSVVEERIRCDNENLLTPKDSLYQWLDKIRFRYVPAIKSEHYFIKLMEELHDVLNLKFEHEIKTKGSNFIFGLQQITENISRDLHSAIGIKNTLQVPSDFKQLFARLDFGIQKDENIYRLSQRGDGVKIRHIPIILNHMAFEEKNLSKRGYVSPDTIWGFEEPENNLELKYCYELANDFLNYSKDLQIFITTHSPAFYSLNDESKVNTLVVRKTEDETNIKPIEDINILNEEMGLLPLISPYITKIYKHEQEIEEMKLQLSLLKDNVKFLVLTEDQNSTYLLNYLKIHGIKSEEIEIISYGTCTQFKTTAFKLAEYVLQKRKLQVIMHRDRDYLSDNEAEDIIKVIRKKEYFPLIPKGVDIESLFVNAQHINHLYPEISLTQAESIITKSIDFCEQKSIDKLIDHHFKINPKPDEQAYAKKFRELNQLYHSNKMRYFYGKTTLGQIKSEIQKILKKNIVLDQASPFIRDEDLVKLVGFDSQKSAA